MLELQEKIVQRYPDATFDVFEGEEPRGTYLRAIVDVDDLNDLIDVVIDRLIEMEVEEGLPVYFAPSRPR